MPHRPPRLYRHREVSRVRNHLVRHSYPRLQMFLLVSLTGGAGFLASYTLLHVGLVAMWTRYLAAFGLAYLVFLGLLWLWLRTKVDDYIDIPDPTGLIPSRGSASHDFPDFHGDGGAGGGGGASGSFDPHPIASIDSTPTDVGPSDPIGDALGSAGDAVGAADELAVPLLLIVAAAAMLLSALWIVYTGPTLFAELLVDGVLAASLYHRLRGLDTQHWLETAVRGTWAPFLLTAMIVAAAGWGMGIYAPGAHSIGEVIHHRTVRASEAP
jgi:hypothetical protein